MPARMLQLYPLQASSFPCNSASTWYQATTSSTGGLCSGQSKSKEALRKA